MINNLKPSNLRYNRSLRTSDSRLKTSNKKEQIIYKKENVQNNNK